MAEAPPLGGAVGGHAGICLESCAPICAAIEDVMQVSVRATGNA